MLSVVTACYGAAFTNNFSAAQHLKKSLPELVFEASFAGYWALKSVGKPYEEWQWTPFLLADVLLTLYGQNAWKGGVADGAAVQAVDEVGAQAAIEGSAINNLNTIQNQATLDTNEIVASTKEKAKQFSNDVDQEKENSEGLEKVAAETDKVKEEVTAEDQKLDDLEAGLVTASKSVATTEKDLSSLRIAQDKNASVLRDLNELLGIEN
jgi:hypothetical protein